MSVKPDLVPQLQNIPYGRDVQTRLIDLACAMSGKKKPSGDYHNLNRPHNLFVDSRDITVVLERISMAFQQHGYLAPWELDNKLIAMSAEMAQSDVARIEEATRFASQYTAPELAPDPMTGFYQKPLTPEVIGYASLYQQITGKPVSVAFIDLSNNRGTNDHYAGLLSTSLAKPRAAVMDRAMIMTDIAARIISETYLKTISTGLPQDGRLIPLRAGGDEMMIVAVGMDVETLSQRIDEAEAENERNTATLGLHNHRHAKSAYANNPERNGYGAAAAVFALKIDGQYEDTIAKADGVIEQKKNALGHARYNNPEFNSLKPPGWEDPELLFASQSTAQMHLHHVMAKLQELRGTLGIGTIQTKLPSIEDLIGEYLPRHFPTPDDIGKQLNRMMQGELKSNNIELTPQDARLLEIKTSKFPAMDYVTGTLSSRDFPAMAGIALEVTDRLSKVAGKPLPVMTMGINIYNLGGWNRDFGHEVANVMLNDAVQDIIIPALHKEKLNERNFMIAHLGNGDIQVLITPLVINGDGTGTLVSQKSIDRAAAAIQSGLQSINDMTTADFYARHRLPLPNNGSSLPARLGDVENTNAALRPHENGIGAHVVVKPYAVDPALQHDTHAFRGGRLSAFIRREMQNTIDETRASYGEPAREASPQPHPSSPTFNVGA